MSARSNVCLALFLLWPALVSAQPAPLVGTTLRTTDTTASSVRVGCTQTGTCTGGIVSGAIDVASVTSAGFVGIATGVPASTTMRLYNNAGTLTWNGVVLATGASLSGTIGKLGKFTAANAIGDSICAESGTTLTCVNTLAATTGTFTNIGGTLSTASQTSITGVGTLTAGTWTATKIGLAYGGTNADLSGTGGAGQFLKQATLGGVVTVVRPAMADVSDATTWTGNTSISSVGTITTGVWNAGAVTSSGAFTSSTSAALTGATNNVGTITTGVWNAGAVTSTGSVNGINSAAVRNGSGSFGAGAYTYIVNAAATDGMMLQLNASNGLDIWGVAASVGTLRATLSTAGLFTVTGVGTHSFTGAGAGAGGTQGLTLANTTSGTTGTAVVTVTAGTSNLTLQALSQGYTTSAYLVQSGAALIEDSAGGLSLGAVHASGAMRFYTGGSTLRWGINAAGDTTFGASSHIADSSGTPTISSGFGTSPSIAGTDYALIVTVGSSPNTTGTIAFGHTWSTTPVCSVTSNQSSGAVGYPFVSTISTTQLVINGSQASAFVASTNIYIICRGY